MSDQNEIANRLYGDTQPPAPPPPPAAVPAPDDRSDQARAERMFGGEAPPEPRTDVPDEIKELRAGDTARRMFPGTAKALAAELPEGSLPGIDVAEAAECALDLGAEAVDLRELRTLVVAEPDPEGWQAASREMMKRQGFGEADLDAARQLARRDPRVLNFLVDTGLGDHPKVVERFIHLARRARVGGTLKPRR